MAALQERYRVPLCPYLAVGNRRVLVHLDAYCVPQSFNWPRPGSPDRLGWRDPFDEWPYWDELPDESISMRMPYFDYTDGSRDYLHSAIETDVRYLEDTNVLTGHYVLPGGARVDITTFVASRDDVWIRHYSAEGEGNFVLQSEFFEKAVRRHPLAHLGSIDFRGAFDAIPKGVYVVAGTVPLVQQRGKVEIPIQGKREWTIYLCIGNDLSEAERLCEKTLSRGYESLKDEAVASDRAWISKAEEPTSTSQFVRGRYRRWLLANSLCLAEDGAMVAGPRPFWSFAWPRDCACNAAAFAMAGFTKEGQDIVKWHLDNMPESCIHEARYNTDRTPMLLDNRLRQGDNPGFLAWAASIVCRKQWDDKFVQSIKDMLFGLADHLVRYHDNETLLPLPEPDYHEGLPSESIGVAVPSIMGLNGLAYVAERLGLTERASIYRGRASEIKQAVYRYLWKDDGRYFFRSTKPLNEDIDVIVCLGCYPPFGAWDDGEESPGQAIQRLRADRWNRESGGVLYGPGTPVESMWLFHAGMLLLGAAWANDHDFVSEILHSFQANASPQGLMPEQIGMANGSLWGCSYFTTTQACLLLFAYSKSGGRCA